MNSVNYPTLVKTTLWTGQSGVTVVASLPTNQSRDVMGKIPIDIQREQTLLDNEIATKFLSMRVKLAKNVRCVIMRKVADWLCLLESES